MNVLLICPICQGIRRPYTASDKQGRRCRFCHARYMRVNRVQYADLTEDQRRKDITRSYAGVYKRRGKIAVEPCIVCGAAAEMHHQDYDQPTDVVWLCRAHHLEFHRLFNALSGENTNERAVCAIDEASGAAAPG